MTSAPLHHVPRAVDVRALERRGSRPRRGQRGAMHDGVDRAVPVERLAEIVPQILADRPGRFRSATQPDDLMPATQQKRGEIPADEPIAAGQQSSHGDAECIPGSGEALAIQAGQPRGLPLQAGCAWGEGHARVSWQEKEL